MVDASPHIDLMEVRKNPHEVAARLLESGAIFGLASAEVRFQSDEVVCFWMTLEPWLAPAAEGYPIEEVAITVKADGEIMAVPRNAAARTWLHRFPGIDFWWLGRDWSRWFASAPRALQEAAVAHAHAAKDPQLLGQLCLWYPGDPPSLQWNWADGLVAYVTIVHRHLQAEEFWRRNGRWPAEDAPHGEGDHPIRTLEMQAAAALCAA